MKKVVDTDGNEYERNPRGSDPIGGVESGGVTRRC